MSERTDDLTVEDDALGTDESVDVSDDFTGVDESIEFETADTDFETGVDAAQSPADTETDASGAASGRLGDAFSLPAFAVQIVGALVGLFVIGGALPLGPLSGVVGILVALFGLGLVSTAPRYAEAGIAGALAGVLITVVTTMSLSLLSGGLLPVAGGIAGGVAALVGHYAGRDLRDGLTREL